MTMQIKVLGPGCPNCQRPFETTCQAVDEFGLDAHVELGHDLAEMLSYGVMGWPLLIGPRGGSGRMHTSNAGHEEVPHGACGPESLDLIRRGRTGSQPLLGPPRLAG